MRFSVRWLRNYLKTDAPLDAIIEALYGCGLEVEQVLDIGARSGRIVTARIDRIEAIPGADKIRLCIVQADEPEPLKIVCGAHNIAEGDIVPLARFGFTFPDGTVLKPRKIMGIEGQGMLCSPREIGVSDEASGIWILPPDTPVGQPYDALIEISITPNRPDALSIVGVARDLAARLGVATGRRHTVTLPDLSVTEGTDRTDAAARVTVEARAACPRYAARVIRNVRIGPSPRWMQIVLEAAGLRPINNVVDVTNYVLLELGHPLHAFDLDRLAGRQIVVRHPRPGEKITTLDGAENELTPEDLLICDAEKPVALAGIMGGANSEISEGTTNVLLESAYFNPATIRRTSKRLDKSTDASYRFERGADPKGVVAALNRAAQLIGELAGGTVLRGHIDVVATLPEKEPILLRLDRVNALLGLSLSGREVTDALTPLGFEILRTDGKVMSIGVPSWRHDVSLDVDLVEELARIIGYDRIAETRLSMPSVYTPVAALDRARTALVGAAVARGLHQAINFSFINPAGNELVGRAGDGREIRILNPITSDMGVMRRSLLPGLLGNVAHNFNHGVEEVALFEVGHTYEFADAEASPRDDKAPTPPAVESPVFAAILAGGTKPSWKEAEREADFFAAKGLLEYLLAALGITRHITEPATDITWLHPGRSARLVVKGAPVAIVGEIHPSVLRQLDIKKKVCYLEIPLAGVVVEGESAFKYTDIGRFPAVTRDVALVVDRAVASADLERTIRKAGRELLRDVRLFDVYEGDRIEAGRKSLAYTLTFRALDRTLKDAEVNEAQERILAALTSNHGAQLRA